MAHVITMPRYGANMEEGLIGEWMVSEGDAVTAGTVLCTVEIEKLTNEVESPAEGIVQKIFVEAGNEALCGEPLCIVAQEGEDLSSYLPSQIEKPVEASETQSPQKSQPLVTTTKVQKPIHVQKGRRPITPKALQLAEDLSVAWEGLQGSGIGGMITREDIRAAQSLPKSAQVVKKTPSATNEIPRQSTALSGARKITAQRMMESVHHTAQAAIWMDCDITDMMQSYTVVRETLKKDGVRLSMTAVFLQKIAQALIKHPVCRTQIDESGNMVVLQECNIAVAVAAPSGLLVPVIRSVETKTLQEIARELSDMSDRARLGALSVDEMKGQTMTVSNLGMYGVTYMRPVLNLPESVILGFGAAKTQPVYINGGLFARNILPVSMTFDHRIIDGGPAAAFLKDVCTALQEPIR